MVEALSLPRYLDSSIPIAVAFSEGFGQVWAMVALKFVEIFWIRCPQIWRLILGYLSSEKRETRVNGSKGVVEKNKFVREKGLSNTVRRSMNCRFFFGGFPLQILSVNRYEGSRLQNKAVFFFLDRG